MRKPMDFWDLSKEARCLLSRLCTQNFPGTIFLQKNRSPQGGLRPYCGAERFPAFRLRLHDRLQEFFGEGKLAKPEILSTASLSF
ncbi:Uncharacterised protein [Legionella spiritensis]|nr:Uncharacterised protein [Legionella spiritensis]